MTGRVIHREGTERYGWGDEGQRENQISPWLQKPKLSLDRALLTFPCPVLEGSTVISCSKHPFEFLASYPVCFSSSLENPRVSVCTPIPPSVQTSALQGGHMVSGYQQMNLY